MTISFFTESVDETDPAEINETPNEEILHDRTNIGSNDSTMEKSAVQNPVTKVTDTMSSSVGMTVPNNTLISASPVFAGSFASLLAALHSTEQEVDRKHEVFAEAVYATKPMDDRIRFLTELRKGVDKIKYYRKLCFQRYPALAALHIQRDVDTSSPQRQRDLQARYVVPNGLPSLQLVGGAKWDSWKEQHDSAATFVNVLTAKMDAYHLPHDEHWERLLEMCLNTHQTIWFRETVAGRGLPWHEAKDTLVEWFDSPLFRHTMLLSVIRIEQKQNEPIRKYVEKFRTMCFELGCEETELLVVKFLGSLLPEYAREAYAALESQYGSKIPTDLDKVFKLVVPMTKENKRLRVDDENDRVVRPRYDDKQNKRLPIRKEKADQPPKQPSNPCRYCSKQFFHGHKCKEYYQAKMKDSEGKDTKKRSRSSVARAPPRRRKLDNSDPSSPINNRGRSARNGPNKRPSNRYVSYKTIAGI
ncbi:hypothetical protein DFQ28_005868 [Apophysomyces sp. BC1034]|nr:hypothetical protein DFQ30_003952 [Apophysomyces sp. BC1015]KAG0176212.1 hypothetical protein DFQ29_006415 [Apophysomyces sp. BC1021]KAG0193251.1 hypothetical protein DFQ28_005868 [Apophysomyces sp. BC1034]